MSSKIEDLIYSQTLKEYGLNKVGDNVWSKKEAIVWYENKCERVIKNLGNRECNWQKIFSDNDANHMLQQLTKEDDKFKNTKKRVLNEKFGTRQAKPKVQRNQSNNKISSIQNLNSSTESGLSLKIKNGNESNNNPFLPMQPSFYALQNDPKLLSNDIFDVGMPTSTFIGDAMYCDDYDLGFTFDDDNTNIPEPSTQTIAMQESLQQQRDREREQRLLREQTVEIDNNMLDLIMDF